MTTQQQWNPRYVAYAVAHGRSPEDMLAHDRSAWPGGVMAGFMLWMSDRWQEWRSLHGYGTYDVLFDADHASFDEMIGVSTSDG